jgi:hypothetical protein
MCFIWEGLRLIEERRGANVVTYVYEPESYAPLARIDATGQSTEYGGLGTTTDSDRGEPVESKLANFDYFHADQVGLPKSSPTAKATFAGVRATKPGA